MDSGGQFSCISCMEMSINDLAMDSGGQFIQLYK